MPFYEYQCSACGHHREELQKVTDRTLRKCPACGKSALRRLVSAPVFRLKGGGWYETDFKADKEQQRNLAGDKEPAAADAAPAGKPKDDKAAGPEKSAAPATEAKPAAAKPDAAPAKPAPKPATARRRRLQRRPSR
ncbi:MAG: FmdB family zinc ribbon protein [Steroidobacteraceae bacterium]